MPPDIIPRMTPAVLPGFYPHIHAETREPCLLQSPNTSDYVQGMLIFGEGQKGRDLIHRRLRPHTRRVTVVLDHVYDEARESVEGLESVVELSGVNAFHVAVDA